MADDIFLARFSTRMTVSDTPVIPYLNYICKCALGLAEVPNASDQQERN